MGRSRTNIEIDDDNVRAVMERFQLRTKTDAVDFALRYAAGDPMSLDEALAVQGAHLIEEIPPDRGPR